MTFGGAPSVFRLRQANPTGNGLLGLILTAILVYTVAGFGVYWLQTGSTTIGQGGRLADLGGLVWFGPIAIVFPALVAIGDRGPFRALHDARTTITVGPDGIAWWTARAGDGHLAWPQVGGVSRTRTRYRTTERVFLRAGAEAVSFEGPFTVEGRPRSVSLPAIFLEARPTSFVPIDPRHPERGCVRVPGED